MPKTGENGRHMPWRQWYIKSIVAFAWVGVLIFIFWQGGQARAQDDMLTWGSSGAAVSKVQAVLNQWGYYTGPIDGYFSNKTQRAVKEFQKKNGLVADGTVGPETWVALGFSAKGYSSPQVSQAAGLAGGITNRDSTYLLARVIEGEAADEAYVGKVAVGAVIMNRTESNAFPNSLAGVIYQPDAFESVTNGQYTRAVSAESLRAAQAAMSGWDPTGGALYFWNPNKPVNPWIWSRQTVGKIGRHVFAL